MSRLFIAFGFMILFSQVTGMHNLQQIYFDGENDRDEADEFHNEANTVSRHLKGIQAGKMVRRKNQFSKVLMKFDRIYCPLLWSI